MYLMEKTVIEYEKEMIALRQKHLKTCFRYEQQIKDLKEIIDELKHTYCLYKYPDDSDGEANSFSDE